MFVKVHRGSREIGGSCVEIQGDKGSVLIDIGLPLDFINENLSPEKYHEKGIFPDIPGLYKDDPRSTSIDAVLISHGHLDHYGIIPFIKEDIPVVMGSLTWEIIRASAPFLNRSKVNVVPGMFLQNARKFEIGGFTITPYLMDHSAFDAYGFLITAEDRIIFYSGDFRNHGRKGVLLERFLNEAPEVIDALILEGTNLSGDESEAQKSEIEVERRVRELCYESDNLVMAYCSSQNIDRIVSLYKGAKKSGRMLVVDIYTAHILLAASRGGNTIPIPGLFKDVRVYYPHKMSTKLAKQGESELLYFFKHSKITRQEIDESRKDILMLVRPSIIKELELIGNLSGAILIYSLWEGYKQQTSVASFLSFLKEQGTIMEIVHTSGHADRNTLQQVAERLRPKKLIPIHTLKPEKYQELFSEAIVCMDGQVVTV